MQERERGEHEEKRGMQKKKKNVISNIYNYNRLGGYTLNPASSKMQGGPKATFNFTPDPPSIVP